jgi:glycine betaine transporter
MRVGWGELEMKLRHEVFWPPFLMVWAALALNFYDSDKFLSLINGLNNWLLGTFSDVFAFCGIFVLWVCVAVFCSPLAKTRIGGPHAKPLLSFRSWCCVSLCTSTAAGILFWGMAEPIYHLMQPPESLHLVAGSDASAAFAMSTLFMHWSFTPSAIYALPALMFALAFYNLGLPFSISSMLQPLLGTRLRRWLSTPIDVIALYTLVLGMAASLGTGILTVSGGISYLWGIESSPLLWMGIGTFIVVSFILSAILGLDRGIKNLSLINSGFFMVLAVYVLCLGVPDQVWKLSLAGLLDYGSTFVNRSLFLEFSQSDPWPQQWTVFFWAVWLAWTPVTAGFLGRIGRGYTVRQFLVVNLVVPSVFAVLWMGVFGGTALGLERSGSLGLSQLLSTAGPESMAYAVLAHLPFSEAVIPVFVFLVCISYITAADSNTVTMSAMSTCGVSAENSEVSTYLNILWGALVGIISLVMLVHSGVNGIKTLSYLGGFPALFLELATACSLLIWAWGPSVGRVLRTVFPNTPLAVLNYLSFPPKNTATKVVEAS